MAINRLVLCSLLSSLLAVGCGRVVKPSGAGTGSGTGTGTGTGTGSGSGTVPDLPTAICLPQPTAHVPSMPITKGMLPGACVIDEQSERDLLTNKLLLVTRYTRSGLQTVVTVTASNGTSRTSASYAVDVAGHLVSHDQYSSDGSAVQTRSRYAYDSAGRLVLDERTYKQSATRIEQRFDAAGRLVERTQHTTSGSGKTVRWAWRYDPAGRLIEATYGTTAAPAQYRTTWRYDSVGRPVELRRESKEMLLSHYTWTWQADGQLSSRTVARNETFYGVGLDDYEGLERADDYGYYTNYYASHKRPGADGSCLALPFAVGDGYQEPDYQLGFSRDEAHPVARLLEANGVAQSPYGGYYGYYGYYGYGYGYGYYGYYGYYAYGASPAWHGHLGAGGGWLANIRNRVPLSAQIDYGTHGRMTRERVEQTTGSGETQRVLVHERVRTFEGAKLVQDRATLQGVPLNGQPDDPPSSVTRTLRFERDGGGRLLARALHHGDTLLERHVWRRDSAGRAVEHSIAQQTGAAVSLTHDPFYRAGEIAPETPQVLSTMRREFRNGQLVSESDTPLRPDGAHGMRLDLSYHEDGNVRELSRVFDVAQDGTRQVWRFDAAGRETYNGATDTTGEFVSYTETERNSAGFVTKLHRRSGAYERLATTRYSCTQ